MLFCREISFLSASGKPASMTVHTAARILVMLLLLASIAACSDAGTGREVLSLNGTWRVQRGGAELPTTRAQGEIPVPGLTDQARSVNGDGAWWWLERDFTLDRAASPVAMLKINKAKYSTRVYLNGRLIGDSLPNFTPQYHDLLPALDFHGANRLVIRLGTFRSPEVPKIAVDGYDAEIAGPRPSGIGDDISLILSGTPRILSVQTAPQPGGILAIRAVVEAPLEAMAAQRVDFAIRRAGEPAVIASATATSASFSSPTGSATTAIDLTIPIPDCRWWTPEEPVLYAVTTRTSGDERTDRFGMRTVGFDSTSKRFTLNGQPYALFGTNVCINRFEMDPHRGALIWDREWVRRLIRSFKGMHWNSARFSIGLPPEFWYEICDEEGFLVQDEFPIWRLAPYVTAEQLASEGRAWILDRCNHPCVYVWDLSNETKSDVTSAAVELLRPLDLQQRRWENGTLGFNKWPLDPNDPVEAHRYPFQEVKTRTLDFLNRPLEQRPPRSPIIVNEYGWLWLARDGSPTTLTYRNYEFLTGGGIGSGDCGSEDARRYVQATYMAAITELFRADGTLAALHEFGGLIYSLPNPQQPWLSGQTSDHFLEPIADLRWDPYYASYARDAFAPVGIYLGQYRPVYAAGETVSIPVTVINDSASPWQGAVRLYPVAGGFHLSKKELPPLLPGSSASCTVPAHSRHTVTLSSEIPKATGDYTLVADLGEGGSRVQSVRDFCVGKRPHWDRPQGALVAPAAASGSGTAPVLSKDGWTWKSGPVEKSWIQFDLGSETAIDQVLLKTGHWDYPVTARIEVSMDGTTWRSVASRDNLAPLCSLFDHLGTTARHLRVAVDRVASPGKGWGLTGIEIRGPASE